MIRSVHIGAVLLFAVAAFAQESGVPKTELGFNYSLAHLTSTPRGTDITSNGGSGYFVYNINSVLGAVADFGAYHNGSQHGSFNSDTTFTYLFGPRFSWRRWSRITPYTQFLFGGARISASIANPAGSAYSADQNNFALAAGGGIDISVTRHVAVKPVQVEYLMTEASNFAGNQGHVQNGLRYSAGVVFRFGER